MASASSSPRLGFLGAGMMAEALAKGFDKAGVARASDMVATDINAERMAVFAGAPPF
jgi:pyrroline-5-carboxylate reductase